MNTYHLLVETLTDTMLGSGLSVPGLIDNDIRYDDQGIPYMNAKTMKGLLGRQIRWIHELFPDEFKNVNLSVLLGSPDVDGEKRNGKLHFTALHLPNGIVSALQKAVKENKITKNELLDGITVMYSYTALDENGIAKDHSLRRVRMIKKGFLFETEIYTEQLAPAEEKLLCWSVSALQHIGTYKSKGKGLVRCRIQKDGKNLEDIYIKGDGDK